MLAKLPENVAIFDLSTKNSKTNVCIKGIFSEELIIALACEFLFTSQFLKIRFEKQSKNHRVKILAHNMAKAVMQFWHSIELLLDNDVPDYNGKIDSSEESGHKRNSEMETIFSEMELKLEHRIKPLSSKALV
ncbi:hypothetical protein RJT34_03484 [Clitoria ternatea]|uniref:Uncharacterized protein n=1 Tax=Clitoria ternatea TaxID=43366 RepID=A0AAN9KJW3_CLITE